MAEDTGVEVLWDQEAENLVDVDVVEEAANFLVRSILTRWLATNVGCVAIWPATTPNRSSHKGVAMQCPLVKISLNPGKKALVDVVVDGQFDLVV